MPLFQRGAPLAFLAALAGCGPAPEADPGFWRPIARVDASGQPEPGPDPDPVAGTGGSNHGGSAGSGNVAGSGGAGGTGGTGGPVDASGGRPDANPDGMTGGAAPDAAPRTGPSPTCTLAVTVTTVTTGRDYAPDNIGAIWIADAGGRFLKSLAVWANRRIQHLPRWNMVTNAAGMPRNRVDAVTGATVGNHPARTVSWNCSDTARQQVPDGNYQVCYEMTESNSSDNNPPSRFQCLMFSKGPMGFELMPPDAPGFRARRLRYVP